MLDFTPEENQLIQKAQAYDSLLRSPAWKYLIDSLAAFADDPLSRIRSASPSPVVLAALARQWKEREALLGFVQNEGCGTVERRNDFMRDYLSSKGVPASEIDEILTRPYLRPEEIH